MKKLALISLLLSTLLLTSCGNETTSIVEYKQEKDIIKERQDKLFQQWIPNVKLEVLNNLKELKNDYKNEFISDIKNNKFKWLNNMNNLELSKKQSIIKRFCNFASTVNWELNTQNSAYITWLFSKDAKKEMTLVEYNTFDNFNKWIYSCSFDMEIIADKTKKKRVIETIDIPVSENLDFTYFDKIIDDEFKKLSDINKEIEKRFADAK